MHIFIVLFNVLVFSLKYQKKFIIFTIRKIIDSIKFNIQNFYLKNPKLFIKILIKLNNMFDQ